MSGICGAVALGGRSVEVLVAERMAAAAAHRGAGSTLVWAAPEGAVVEQRRQRAPGQHEGRRPAEDVVVVADARLDNRPELRQALTRTGYLRPSDSTGDAALLRAAFAAWGDNFPARLVGDFVVVVWDRRRSRLLAARDPMAMRTLYYRREPSGAVLFGTEVKQVLAAPGVPADIDESVVAADLVGDFGRPDRSFFRGVDQVPPGTLLICDAAGDTVRRFWDIDPHHRIDCHSVPEAAEEVRRVFLQAVATRLEPQGATGVLLSGGVDSGSVASAAGWLREHDPAGIGPLHAYSWAFTTMPECDERHISRHVVERYALLASDVSADDAGPLACYPEHSPDLDDPFLGGFQPLIEHALQLARSHGVHVLLGGDRGDLVIGNSGWGYLRMLEARQWAGIRTSLREQKQVLGEPWPAVVRHDLLGALRHRLRRRSPREWAAWGVRRATRSDRRPAVDTAPAWLRPSFLARVDLESARAPTTVPDGLDAARALRYGLIFTPMHLRGMAWSERTYARYGLAFADPFSDRRLVELVLALPQVSLNRPNDQSKPLMRAAMRGVMPEAARRSATKIVPRPLFDSGLRRRAVLVRELLTAPLVEQRGWADGGALREHFDAWLGGAELDPRFWWAVQVETWLRARQAAGG